MAADRGEGCRYAEGRRHSYEARRREMGLACGGGTVTEGCHSASQLGRPDQAEDPARQWGRGRRLRSKQIRAGHGSD